MKRVLLLLATSGCAQLLGLDDTTGTSVDAPGPGAHATFRHASIGTTTITGAYDFATTDKIAFLVADANDPSGYRKVTPTIEAPGAWHADLDTAPIVDTTINNVRRIYELPTSDLHVELTDLEHPNAEAASPTASINLSINIPAYAAPDTFELQAIGAWSYYGLSAAETPTAGAVSLAVTEPYTNFAPIGGHPITRIIPADTFVVVRHNGNDLTGVFQTSFDQGETATVTGTLAPVTAGSLLDANIAQATIATRYTAVRPAVSSLVVTWDLHAAPGYAHFQAAGPLLAAQTSMPADTKISRMYGNPFTSLGWHELFGFITYETRAAMVGGVPVGLAAAMVTYLEPTPNVTMDLPVGLPQTVSVNDVPLATDDMTVDVPAKGVRVTSISDRPTDVLYRAVLFDIVVTGTTAALTAAVEVISTDKTKLWIPADAFQTGHVYMIQYVTYSGTYPNAASGDLSTMQPPYHYAYNDSGTFTANKL